MAGRRLTMSDIPEFARAPGWPALGEYGAVLAQFYILDSVEDWYIRLFTAKLWHGVKEEYLGGIDSCGPSTTSVPMLIDGTFDVENIPPAYHSRWKDARWSFSVDDLVAYRDHGTVYCPVNK